MTYVVHIRYEGEMLKRKGKRAQYEDTVILDLEVFHQAVRLEGNPTKRIVEALGEIRKAIKEANGPSLIDRLRSPDR